MDPLSRYLRLSRLEKLPDSVLVEIVNALRPGHSIVRFNSSLVSLSVTSRCMNWRITPILLRNVDIQNPVKTLLPFAFKILTYPVLAAHVQTFDCAPLPETDPVEDETMAMWRDSQEYRDEDYRHGWPAVSQFEWCLGFHVFRAVTPQYDPARVLAAIRRGQQLGTLLMILLTAMPNLRVFSLGAVPREGDVIGRYILQKAIVLRTNIWQAANKKIVFSAHPGLFDTSFSFLADIVLLPKAKKLVIKDLGSHRKAIKNLTEFLGVLSRGKKSTITSLRVLRGSELLPLSAVKYLLRACPGLERFEYFFSPLPYAEHRYDTAEPTPFETRKLRAALLERKETLRDLSLDYVLGSSSWHIPSPFLLTGMLGLTFKPLENLRRLSIAARLLLGAQFVLAQLPGTLSTRIATVARGSLRVQRPCLVAALPANLEELELRRVDDEHVATSMAAALLPVLRLRALVWKRLRAVDIEIASEELGAHLGMVFGPSAVFAGVAGPVGVSVVLEGSVLWTTDPQRVDGAEVAELTELWE